MHLCPVVDLQARMQRGSVYLKQGRLDEAHIDFETVVSAVLRWFKIGHGSMVELLFPLIS